MSGRQAGSKTCIYKIDMVSVVNNVTNYKVSSLSMVNYAITLLIQVFRPVCLPHAWRSGNALAKGARGAGFKSRQNQCEKKFDVGGF